MCMYIFTCNRMKARGWSFVSSLITTLFVSQLSLNLTLIHWLIYLWTTFCPIPCLPSILLVLQAKHCACHAAFIRWEVGSKLSSWHLCSKLIIHWASSPGVMFSRSIYHEMLFSGGKLLILRHLVSVHFWSHNFYNF